MIFKEKYLKPCCPLVYRVIRFLYLHNSITRKFAMWYINKFEGGSYYSQSLRKIYKEHYDIDVGLGSYGGIFSTSIRPHVRVGRYCSFAWGIQRLYANHPLEDVSTHPLFHLKEFGIVTQNNNKLSELSIGNDVWIGVNAIITSSCKTIGDGAVIGAGSVVTHNVEPYAVVAGNPAKVIKYRFPEEIRHRLIQSMWWRLNPSQLKDILSDNPSIEGFLLKVSEMQTDLD